MIQLYQSRLARHLSEVVKYLRYVFNDFFVIALMFLIGGLGLSYSNLLKQLHPGLWWSGIVVLIVLLVSQSFNHLATLIEPADRVFLIPREVEMHSYLKAAFGYSLAVASITQALIWFILLPFIRVTLDWHWPQLISLLVSMILLKAFDFQLVINAAYASNQRHFNLRIYRWLVALIIMGGYLWNSYWLQLILTLLALGIVLFDGRNARNRSLKWTDLITAEEARMLSLYKFFNLFTDVPDIQRATKRRHYLDFLINRIKSSPQNIYLYLYGRSIVRNGEYSGLYIRLTLIGAVILFGVGGIGISVLTSLLFIYLIGFQLIPFYFYFDNNVFTHVYPLQAGIQLRSFQRIVSTLLIITTILFAIMAMIGSHSIINGGIILMIDLIEVWLLINRFIPHRINKKLN